MESIKWQCTNGVFGHVELSAKPYMMRSMLKQFGSETVVRTAGLRTYHIVAAAEDQSELISAKVLLITRIVLIR